MRQTQCLHAYSEGPAGMVCPIPLCMCMQLCFEVLRETMSIRRGTAAAWCWQTTSSLFHILGLSVRNCRLVHTTALQPLSWILSSSPCHRPHSLADSVQAVWTLEKDRADVAAESERYKQVRDGLNLRAEKLIGMLPGLLLGAQHAMEECAGEGSRCSMGWLRGSGPLVPCKQEHVDGYGAYDYFEHTLSLLQGRLIENMHQPSCDPMHLRRLFMHVSNRRWGPSKPFCNARPHSKFALGESKAMLLHCTRAGQRVYGG